MNASLQMLARGISRGRSSLEELVLLNTAETAVTEVTFLLLSGLRVFRATMKRPLAKEVMERLAQGKCVPSFGDLEEVEVGFLARRPSAQVHALEVSIPLKMSWLTLLGWGPR